MPSFIWDAATQQYRNLHPKRAPEPINYSELIKQKALLYSFPLSNTGTRVEDAYVNILKTASPNNPDPDHYTDINTHPGKPPVVMDAWTYKQAPPSEEIGDRAKAMDFMGDTYYAGKQEARDRFNALPEIQALPAARRYPPRIIRSTYANCSGFTGAVIINTVDPYFPGDNNTSNQWAYVSTSDNWELIGDSRQYNASQYKPGDIFLTPPASGGHTFMWIGNYTTQNGTTYTEVIAEASYAERFKRTLILPSLRRITAAFRNTGLDTSERWYEIWRYVGENDTAPIIIKGITASALFKNSTVKAVLRNPNGTIINQNSIIDITIDVVRPEGAGAGQVFRLETQESDIFQFTDVDAEITSPDGAVFATAERYYDGRRLQIILTENGATGDTTTLHITAGVKTGATGTLGTKEFSLYGYDGGVNFSTLITTE